MHPELEHVWEDLDKVGVQAPEPAEQPKDLKLNLLPFQREGLGWMRKQENTPVCDAFVVKSISFENDATFLEANGWLRISSDSSSREEFLL
jgi:hypothetical protein